MASRKKESEGIALLSMYNDEDDEEMGDIEEGDHRQNQQTGEEEEKQQEGQPLEEENEYRESNNNMEEDSRTNDNTPPFPHQNTNLSQQQQEPSVSSPQQPQPFVASKRSGGGRLTIVDYGHDETAMSPEPEEGELGSSDDLMIGIEQQNANGDFQGKTPPAAVQLTPQSSDLEPLQPETLTNAVNESDGVEVEEAVSVDNFDPLDKFLPPPPKVKCSEELQRKIDKFLNLKRAGKSFNAEVRNRKDYRNPDFLLHAVRYQDIDQIGSCFSKDVFDPHGYDKSDFYDEIEADMKCERERKEQESKKNQKVEFVPGGNQPGAVLPAPKVSMPTAVVCLQVQLQWITTLCGMVDKTRNQNGIRWIVIEGILFLLEHSILYLLLEHIQLYYQLLMLEPGTQLLHSRNGEKQKRKNPVKRVMQ
ncbi:SAP30-binding protein isoform X8 [Gossypium hirsutum]|uniref:SAP30-binding protein isoform X8 n=1 Tax=Gossypium hirsutum TaxID=3635 RepID=A0A1U8K3T5_GOSHI|nr:SAP30-binding protein isoform X8 [Gossypium hirsutum]